MVSPALRAEALGGFEEHDWSRCAVAFPEWASFSLVSGAVLPANHHEQADTHSAKAGPSRQRCRHFEQRSIDVHP